jgi:murein DD-endopeptidase MepM/ murein hydrolase activator NlpD
MKIILRKQNVFTFYLLVCCACFAFSQSAENLNADSVVVPANELYLGTWDAANTVVRTGMLDKSKQAALPLNPQGENSFVFPCINKSHVISAYGLRSGRMHTGTDIKQNLGDSIVAAWDGVVRMANKSYYGYGGTVVIRHSNGLETLYAHLSQIEVAPNQIVKAGELIGKAGRTGRATTEHLHFETRFLYTHFNPKLIIDFENHRLCADTLFVKNGKFHGKDAEDSEDFDKDEVTEVMEDEDLLAIIVEDIKSASSITIHHIVKKGDTLYSLSRKYNISIQEICALNNINENNVLSIGQKIKVRK